MDEAQDIPLGLCGCGCGQTTKVATKTYTVRGLVKGRPHRFRPGHHRRGFHHAQDAYSIDPDTGCWIWLRTRSVDGYGHMRDPRTGQQAIAHRVFYEQLVGPIPDGLHLDHLCRNPPCVNPAHLEPVTCRENIRRGWAARRAAGQTGGSVTWRRDKRKWRARITLHGRQHHLGYFATEEDGWRAIEAHATRSDFAGRSAASLSAGSSG